MSRPRPREPLCAACGSRRAGLPRNLVTRKPYRGMNIVLLSLGRPYLGRPYLSPYWLAYRQAQGLGGHVRPGEKASLVTFWKLREAEAPDDGTAPGDARPRLQRGAVRGVARPARGGLHAARPRADPQGHVLTISYSTPVSGSSKLRVTYTHSADGSSSSVLLDADGDLLESTDERG